MNAREAANHVLSEAGEPLHVKEITRRILVDQSWKGSSKTPEATVHAAIAMDIKKKGEGSVFVRVEPATFGLREWGPGPGVEGRGKTYSFTEAAKKVLEQFGDKRPMHYGDITAKALEMKWVSTKGLTPEATMYSQVITEIKRQKSRGEQPRFVKHGRGYFGLSRWMGEGLAFEIEQHNRRVHKALRDKLLEMAPSRFEELIGELLAELGFEDIEVTGRAGDGGIDVRGTLLVGDVIRTRMAVQAKRWKPSNRIQAPVVRNVRGSLGTREQGLIITTSGFSKGAHEEAARTDAAPVGLMDGDQLVALLIGNDIYISRQSHDIIQLEAQEQEDD